MSTRRLSPICFVLSILCFFLTFSTVSCDDRPLATLSGIELAKGTTIHASRGGLLGRGRSEHVPPAKPVILALVAAIAATGLAWSARARRTQLASGLVGSIGAAALLVFRRGAASDVAARSMGMLDVHFRGGFWGALLLMIAGSIAAMHAATARDWDARRLLGGDAEPAWPGVGS